jgi:hypothetical protein
MNDPAFIRDLAAVRLPSGMVSPLQPFELKMSTGGGGSANAPLLGKPGKLNYGELSRGIRPIQLANPVDFGESLQGGAAVSSYYENIALQDGTIKVPQLANGPFRATKVTTYLGVLPSGKLKEDSKAQGSGNLSLAVKAGQAYRVDFSFDPKGLAVKKYMAQANVDDGTSNTINLLASVVEPKGKLQITKDAGDIIAVPGKTVTFNLYVKALGNTPKTQIEIEPDPKEMANLRFDMVSPQKAVSIKNNDVTTIPVTLEVGGNYDRSVTLHLTVKGYDGAATTVFAFPVSIVNQWIDSGLLVHTRKVQLQGGAGTVQQTTYRQFRMNAAGVWNYRATGPIDNATYGFIIEADVNGKKFGVIDPKYSYSGVLSGLDPNLGKVIDKVQAGGFNLSEAEYPKEITHVGIYNSLIAAHQWFKQRGIVNLAEADYQKMLKELKPK